MPAGGPKREQEPTATEHADPETADTTEATVAAAPEPEETTDVAVTETSDTVQTRTADTAQTEADTADVAEEAESAEEPTESPEAANGDKRKIQWPRVLAYGILPGLALVLALVAGFARWESVSSDYGALPPVASEQNPSVAMESMNAARDSTIKMLSYKPDSVDQQLNAARDLLTGEFRNSYTSLINDVVIPGAQQKQISAVASVPAMASVSADPHHAVVLVFVNQTVVVGQDPPTDTASSVRVTLEKIDDRWLISEFEPV